MSLNNPIGSFSSPIDPYSRPVEQYDDIELHFDTIEIKEEDPFHDTDLVVFPDEYEGVLPLNGIKESDFIMIKSKYQEFLDGKTKFSIEEDNKLKSAVAESTEIKSDFTETVTDSIKTLLTREIGRKLFLKILFDQRIKSVVLASGLEAKAVYIDKSFDPSLSDNEVKYIVRINPENKGGLISINNRGEKQYIPSRLYISLGHELIHVSHASASDIEKSPNASLRSTTKPEKNLEIMEEQITITGLRSPVMFDHELTHDIHDEPEEIYDELNENALRSAFELPPRIDHAGVKVKPADLHDLETEEFRKFFRSAITNGLVADVKEILKTSIDVNKKLGKKYPLEYALEAKKSKVIELLIAHGADPFKRSGRDMLIELAFQHLKTISNNKDVKLNRFLSLIAEQINTFIVADLDKARPRNKALYYKLIPFLIPSAFKNAMGEPIFKELFKYELSFYQLDKIAAILSSNSSIIDANEADSDGNTLLHVLLSNPSLEKDIENDQESEVLTQLITALATKENLKMKNSQHQTPLDLAKTFHPNLTGLLKKLT